jgi:drug/metabolite transporter (DMT)-like permease
VAYALALLSSVLWGSADFGGGLLARRLPPVVVVGWSQAAGLIAVGAVALATGASGPLAGWLPWAVAAGVAGSTALVAFYAALAAGTMGVVSPIAALGAVVPLVVGTVAGERPGAVQLAGVALAVGGAVLASGPELRGAAGARPVALAALAGVGFGTALVLIDKGAETSGLLTLTGMRATSVSLFLVAALARRSAGNIGVSDLPALALVGLGDVGANLAYAIASTRGLVSLIAVLASLYPVVTVLLARVVLRERMRLVQDVGVGAALAGVVLVAAG